MIYYFFIVLAVLCFTLQFAFTKLLSAAIRESAVTALCMLSVVGGVGAVLSLIASGFRVSLSPASLLLAAGFAVIMIPYHTLSIKALSLGNLAVYSTFMMLGGMLLPFLYGILLLGENVTWGKLVGCVLLTACIVLQGVAEGRGSERKEGHRVLFFLVCLAIFVINGLTGVVSQTHALHPAAVDEWSFMFLSSAATATLALLSLGAAVLAKKREALAEVRAFLTVRPLGAAALIGLAMNLGNFLILLAAAHVPASVQFPLISGGTIALSAVAALLLFRERISRFEAVTVLGACLSTVLFAF